MRKKSANPRNTEASKTVAQRGSRLRQSPGSLGTDDSCDVSKSSNSPAKPSRAARRQKDAGAGQCEGGRVTSLGRLHDFTRRGAVLRFNSIKANRLDTAPGERMTIWARFCRLYRIAPLSPPGPAPRRGPDRPWQSGACDGGSSIRRCAPETFPNDRQGSSIQAHGARPSAP